MNRNLKNFSDEVLAKMAKEGDSFAEEFLIRKYMGKLKSKAHVYYIMGGDRDDLIQEGMIGIFKAIRNYDENLNVPFTAFMEMCINKQIYNAIESAGRMKHIPLNTSLSLNDDEGKHQVAVEKLKSSELEQPEKAVVFNDLMEEFSREESTILSPLELKVWKLYVKGHSYLEIATILEKSPKTIDNALQRIRKKISAHLMC